MSIALSQPRKGGRSVRQVLPWVGMGVCLSLAAGHVAYDVLGPTRLHAAARSLQLAPGDGKPGPELKRPIADRATTVSLPESKLQEAKIAIELARLVQFSTELGVAGLIQANSD